MSASSKKKLRKEQNAVVMTERQKAAQKEAKKLKIYTWSFWTVMILIVAIVAGIALQGPVNAVVDRFTTSVIVGEHKLNATELNYFYIDAINQYCNEYSSYISYLLDTDKPLDEQVSDATTGTTWADDFVDMAVDNAKNNYALYDAAIAAGHKLSDEEQASVDELYDSMDDYSKQLGYRNASHYLQNIYGKSASKKSYQKYYEVTVMASSYYSAYAQDLKDSYDEPSLREYEKETPYEYNSYSYASFYMNLDDYKTGGTKSEDGETTTYTDAEIKAAEEALKKAAEGLAISDNNTVEKLNAAIAAMEKAQAAAEKDTETSEKEDTTTEPTEAPTEATEAPSDPTEAPSEPTDAADATEPTEADKEDEKEEEDDTKYSTCTENEDVLYSSISSVMNEWIRDEARKEGDITALPYSTKTTGEDGKEVETLKGYYVVLYLGSNDNTYALANVRHILVAFEGGSTNSTTGQTTYSDAEKQTAKKAAEALLEQWKKGDATEDSFAELANKESDDGDGTTGGLYEDVYPGQMVTNFNDWCFDETRKEGDTGIVESTYGYHVMYYVGDSETNYRDYMITNAKLSEEMEEWQTGLNDAIKVTEKNTSRVDKDLVLSDKGMA